MCRTSTLFKCYPSLIGCFTNKLKRLSSTVQCSALFECLPRPPKKSQRKDLKCFRKVFFAQWSVFVGNDAINFEQSNLGTNYLLL